MLWLCLHFPLLPLEVFTRGQACDEHPAAVAEKRSVLCANTLAAEHGVLSGLSASTAQALCAELRLLERAPGREAEALAALADWGYRFTPHIALEPPDRLLLELGASLQLFGGLARLLAIVEEDLGTRRYTHRSGLAPTPLAALLLARARPCTSNSLPAWCEAHDESAFRELLGELPLALLEAPDREQQVMQRMGFTRIGELLALPRAALGKRFGKEFLNYLVRLCGEHPDPRPPHRPREFFHSELHFLDPLGSTQMLLFPMRRLLGELAQFLERRQSYCQRLEWQLQPAHGARQTLPIACSLEHNREAALLALTQLALERLRVAEAVASLVLVCYDFAPVQGKSSDLFGDTAQDGAEAARLLLDRLRLRLGAVQLHGLQLADAQLPEQAWSEVRESTPASAYSPWSQRPVWLLHEPVPLARKRNALDWNGTLELLGGPERIESAWWAEPQHRDYFIARHEHGALCWVFRERESRQWFVQGVFG